MRFGRQTSFRAPAKFPGRCHECHGPIAVGDDIWCIPSSRGWDRQHVECPEEFAAKRRAEADAKRAEHERIVGLLDWKNRVAVSRTEQLAWSDRTTFHVPILDPTASDVDLRASVYTHNQSSYGALRWCTYDVIGRDVDHMVIVEHENLCD